MRISTFVNRGLVPAFLLIVLLAVPSGFAQRYLGSISGQATDPSGAIVPNATVTAEETTTHFKTTGTANNSGLYTFPALNPGTYNVSVKAAGFAPATRTGVELTAGQLQQVDFKLSIEGTNSTVDVQADNLLLDTGSANIATTLSTKEVTDLPNIGRNPFVQATLAAGIVNTASGGFFLGKESGFVTGGVSVQITTNGSSGHNRLTLDGIPDDPAERFSGASYAGFVPSPEAVQEVKVQTSIFDAQIGHGNGTVTNTVVRGGGNQIHGAAYYVFENTYFDANTYERVPNQNLCYPGTAGCTNTILPTRRGNQQLSQTGGVIDGPVVIPKLYNGKDKTFFLFSYERYHQHTSLAYNARVATPAEVAGDFSGLCSVFNSAGLCTNGVQLYDPLSPVDANGNRTTYFANNNIASRITPQGAALASYLPTPDNPGVAITSNTNYISSQTSYPFNLPALIARIDQAIGSKNKVSFIFFKSELSQVYPHQGFPKEIAPTGYGYTVYRNNKGGSVNDVHQFSSSLVLDSRFGIIFHPFGLVYPDSTGYNLSALNIASSNYPVTSFPGASFSDSYAGLAPGAGGQISEDTFGSLEEIVSKTLGRHSVRIGFEGNLIRYNVQNPFSGFGNGGTAGFQFDRRFTEQNSVTKTVGSDPNSGDPFASLLLGYPSVVTYNVATAYALQQIYMAPFIQDDWRFNNKLTLNLGLRYDYESPFTERHNKQASNFCTTCANPLQASVPSLPLNGGLQFTSAANRYPYPKDLNNIQPRLGAAYQATPTTVVRAGFGVIYFNTLETPIGTGFSSVTAYNNYVTSAPINSLANPYPNGVVLPTGSSLGLSTGLGQNITFIDPHHVQPKSVQYSASLQQQFPGNVALQVAYVGTRPTRLEVNHNINVLPSQYYNQGAAEVTYLNNKVTNPLAGQIPQSTNLNGATISQYLLLLPYPEFGTITEQYSSIGSSPYNALQVQVSLPLRHHFSLQGNFTWDKVMLHNAFLPTNSNTADQSFAASGHLESVQDSNPTLIGNIFGIYQFPAFSKLPSWQRLIIGGWQVNGVFKDENGPLLSAPSNVNIIGNTTQPNPTAARYFNTCYLNTAGAQVATTYLSSGAVNSPGCDALSPNPAYQQRLAYTTQANSTVLKIRVPIKPLMDASLFKQFKIRGATNFEIRGEFFNVLNSVNFGAAGTGIGTATFGVITKTQANDARIGQLTARLNF